MPPVLIALILSKFVAIAAFPFFPVSAVVLFVGPDLYLCYHLFAPSAQGLVRVRTHFETPRQEIWLTIDDGPDPRSTGVILGLLDRHQARATFFVIGERVARYPELVREILRRGHTVGHHTHTHPTRTFWCAPASRVRAEIDNAFAALRQAGVGAAMVPSTGRNKKFVSPPGIAGPEPDLRGLDHPQLRFRQSEPLGRRRQGHETGAPRFDRAHA